MVLALCRGDPSYRLGLRRLQKIADTRDRTRDLQIFSLTLSQLSYIGEG